MPEKRCALGQKNRTHDICRRQIPLYKCWQIVKQWLLNGFSTASQRLLNGFSTASQRLLNGFCIDRQRIVKGWSSDGFRCGLFGFSLRVCACVGEINVCFCLCFRGFWYVTNGNSTAVLLYRLLHQNLSMTLSVIFNNLLTSAQTTS